MNSWFVSLGIVLFAVGYFFLYRGLTARPYVIVPLITVFAVIVGIILILWGLASKKKNNKERVNRKILLLIALVIIVSISISYFSLSLLNAGTYEKAIVRNTSNIEEANALTVAESSNYSEIFNLQRFTTGNPNETWPYTWANFIDTQVIEYYDDRFENLKGKPRSIKFRYEANVFTWDQIRVVYVPAPEGGNIYDDAIQVLRLNGSILFENAQYTGPGWGMLFAYRNDSEYQKIMAEEINFSLSKSYVIEMTLRYDEAYGTLAAFVADVYQIIIVDEDFVPFLLCVQSEQFIS